MVVCLVGTLARLRLPAVALCALVGAGAGGATAIANQPGGRALSDGRAAALVHRSPFEPRRENRVANHHRPGASLLARFRAQNTMPYRNQVDGNYTGTTDEIIQWAALKHGLSPDLLRAVAVVESWWRMSTVGDSGDSFGLFQVRRPYHCVTADVCAAFAHDTALNADYYAAILRAYLDGRMGWLNSVPGNGRPYRSGDLWGSVGAWSSGRWHDPGAEQYIAQVRQALAARTWRSSGFR
jgi:hypothetical protein